MPSAFRIPVQRVFNSLRIWIICSIRICSVLTREKQANDHGAGFLIQHIFLTSLLFRTWTWITNSGHCKRHWAWFSLGNWTTPTHFTKIRKEIYSSLHTLFAIFFCSPARGHIAYEESRISVYSTRSFFLSIHFLENFVFAYILLYFTRVIICSHRCFLHLRLLDGVNTGIYMCAKCAAHVSAHSITIGWVMLMAAVTASWHKIDTCWEHTKKHFFNYL